MSDVGSLRRVSYPWLAVLFFWCLHLGLHLYWYSSRPSLVEPDDSYTYILKAAQIADGCFWQDCPAIQDLQKQLAAPALDHKVDWLRYRMLARTTLVYHPLHTIALLGLNKIGLSLEQAFFAVCIVGVLLIGAGLYYLTTSLWGSAGAAAALVVAAVSVFKGQGLLFIVPSTLCLGIALFLWGAVIREARTWIIVVLAICALLMHPVGRLYCLAAVPMMLLMGGTFRIRLGTILRCAAVLLLVGVMSLLPFVFEKPVLSIPSEPIPPGFTWIGGIVRNILTGITAVAFFNQRIPIPAAAIAVGVYFLAWYAYKGSSDKQRLRVRAVIIPLGGLCILALGYVLPHYPGELFVRVWIPLALVLAGGAGYALAGPAGHLWASQAARLPAPFSSMPARTSGIALVVLATSSGLLSLFMEATRIWDRDRETYAAPQVHRAVQDCGTILYSNETAALFYLSHGAHTCATRYLLAAGDGEREALFLDLRTTPRPLLLVGRQPGPRELTLGGPLLIDIPRGMNSRIELNVVSEHKTVVQVLKADGTVVAELATQPDTPSQWITWDRGEGNEAETLRVVSKSGGGRVFLEGLRAWDAQATDGPGGGTSSCVTA